MSRQFILIVNLIIVICIQGCVSASNEKTFSSEMQSVKREVEVGMTKQEVLEILGEPTDIDTTQEEKKFLDEGEEAWYYDKPFFSFKPKIGVSFKNGLVNDIDYIYK